MFEKGLENNQWQKKDTSFYCIKMRVDKRKCSQHDKTMGGKLVLYVWDERKIYVRYIILITSTRLDSVEESNVKYVDV